MTDPLKNTKIRAQSAEAEVLFRIWADDKLIPRFRSQLATSDFYYYGDYYEIICNSYINGGNVTAELQVKGLVMAPLLKEPKRWRKPEEIIADVKNAAASMKIAEVLDNSLAKVDSEEPIPLVAEIQKHLITGVALPHREQTNADSIIKEYRDKQDFYIEKFKAGNPLIGIDTGYPKLNEIIDGIREEHLWVLGGYSSFGKTSAALNITAALVKQGERVVYYSLEMGKVDIMSKLVGIMTNQGGNTIIKGYAHDEGAVADALQRISESHLSIHDTKCELDEIEYSMYEEHLTRPVKLLVVDFLQLVTVKGSKGEYERTTEAIRALQQMAKRLKVCILVLSQISNEGAKLNDEVVSSFKGSGGIIAAADFAIELQVGEESRKDFKEKMHKGLPVCMKWNIRKNRHGRIAIVLMDFDGPTGIFSQRDSPPPKSTSEEVKAEKAYKEF